MAIKHHQTQQQQQTKGFFRLDSVWWCLNFSFIKNLFVAIKKFQTYTESNDQWTGLIRMNPWNFPFRFRWIRWCAFLCRLLMRRSMSSAVNLTVFEASFAFVYCIYNTYNLWFYKHRKLNGVVAMVGCICIVVACVLLSIRGKSQIRMAFYYMQYLRIKFQRIFFCFSLACVCVYALCANLCETLRRWKRWKITQRFADEERKRRRNTNATVR